MKKIFLTLLLSTVMLMTAAGLSMAQTGTSTQQPGDGGSTSSQPADGGGGDSSQPADGTPAPSDDQPDPAAISDIPA